MTAVIDSDIIIRDFTVDPALVGRDATDRVLGMPVTSLDWRVVEDMPRAIAQTGQLHFFNVGRRLDTDELAIELAERRLRIYDPHTVIAFLTANPEFRREHPIAVYWVDQCGDICIALFKNPSGFLGDFAMMEIYKVKGSKGPVTWASHWWFACVPTEEAA